MISARGQCHLERHFGDISYQNYVYVRNLEEAGPALMGRPK